jgi:hypothetical protein
MIIDVMLATSAELELLSRMIRICYAHQVFTVKKEVLNQLSAAMVHSQLQVQRVIKIAPVVQLVITVQKVQLKRFLVQKVPTAHLVHKVRSFVPLEHLVQFNFKYQF